MMNPIPADSVRTDIINPPTLCHRATDANPGAGTATGADGMLFEVDATIVLE